MTDREAVFPHSGHDHTECLGNAIEMAEQHCAQNKLRFTKQRRDVLNAIAQSHKAIGAYDIIELLAKNGKRVAPISVYRTLDFLMENGFVHRLATLNAYIACYHGSEGHSPQFLICDDCGSVGEIDNKEVEKGVEKIAKDNQFKPRQMVVEVNGICKNCEEE